MAGTFSNLTYHIVFSTSNRIPLITDGIADRLHRYIGGIVNGLGGTSLAIGGMPDHIHIVAGMPTSVAVADVVRDVKANSSKWMNESRPESRFGWQRGYGAFTVSQSMVPSVRSNVANQRQHHSQRSFSDEFTSLLSRHAIEFNPRYLP